ncbi:hypothetical protein ACFL6Y_11630, partial [Elusimicrobiota bacterium]
ETGVGGPTPANPNSVNSGQAVFTHYLKTAATYHYILAQEEVTSNGWSSGTSSTFTVTASNPSTVILVLPSEQQINGKDTAPIGRSGATYISTAGVCFSASVYATDDNYNRVTNVNGSWVSITTTDDNDVNPIDVEIVNGSATIANICPQTARTPTNDASPDAIKTDHRITIVDDAAAPNLGTRNSSLFTLNPALANRLQVLAPGENSDPGTTPGRKDNPILQRAGQAFLVRARITDAFWNLVENDSADIRIETTDPNDDEPAVKTVNVADTFSIMLFRSATAQVRIYDDAGVGGLKDSDDYTWSQTKQIDVDAGSEDRIVLVLPGEELNEGATSFATVVNTVDESLNEQVAGVTFSVRVYLTDKYFNVKTGKRDGHEIRVIAPNDTFGNSPGYSGTIDATYGYASITGIDLRRSTTMQYLLAEYVPGTLPSYNAYPPAGVDKTYFDVKSNTPQGVQVLMPWETEVYGGGSYPSGGKTVTGTPSVAGDAQLFAGVSFTVRARVVDSYFNTPTNADAGYSCPNEPCPNVKAITSDKYDSEQVASNFQSNLTREFSLTLLSRATDHTVFAKNEDGTFSPTANAANTTAEFFVESSSPVRLTILVSGESPVEGKPVDVDVDNVTDIGNPAGKIGTPNTLTIPNSTNVVVNLVDAYYNRVRIGTMPKVKIYTVKDDEDDAESTVAAATLFEGEASFPVTPRISMEDYTIGVATTVDSNMSISSATSADLNVHPGVKHHLHFDTDVVSESSGTAGPIGVWSPSVQAGETFNARLTAHDEWHNVLSTGSNIYEGTVTFEAEPFNTPQDAVVAGDQTFTVSDEGTIFLASAFRIRKAGASRYLKATDTEGASASVNSYLDGFSYLPQINVSAGDPSAVQVTVNENEGTVIPSGSSGHSADPDDLEVHAGSQDSVPSSLGRAMITGEMSDQFSNKVSSAGITLYIDVTNVTGSSGAIFFEDPEGTFIDAGISTTVVSDSNGEIGETIPIWYFVSNTADESAMVWVGTFPVPADTSDFESLGQSITGKLTTVGGTPKELYFSDVPSGDEATVNITADYTVARRDAFGNATSLGNTSVSLTLPQADRTVHEDEGFVLATTGIPTEPPYVFGFRNEADFNYVQSAVIYNYSTSQNFKYKDKMASIPSGEDGRTGTWTINAKASGLVEAVHNLTMNPLSTSQIKFDTPKRILLAGMATDTNLLPRVLEVELRDQFENPRITTVPVVLNLTVDREQSPTYDSYDFSLSSS